MRRAAEWTRPTEPPRFPCTASPRSAVSLVNTIPRTLSNRRSSAMFRAPTPDDFKRVVPIESPPQHCAAAPLVARRAETSPGGPRWPTGPGESGSTTTPPESDYPRHVSASPASCPRQTPVVGDDRAQHGGDRHDREEELDGCAERSHVEAGNGPRIHGHDHPCHNEGDPGDGRHQVAPHRRAPYTRGTKRTAITGPPITNVTRSATAARKGNGSCLRGPTAAYEEDRRPSRARQARSTNKTAPRPRPNRYGPSGRKVMVIVPPAPAGTFHPCCHPSSWIAGSVSTVQGRLPIRGCSSGISGDRRTRRVR